jgi:hypothetical protein
MAREMSKIIERARSLTETWLLLEAHFDMQMAFIDGLVSQLLSSERVVNSAQILSYYNKVLQAIREAKELERLQDFLTPNQIETLLAVLTEKGAKFFYKMIPSCATHGTFHYFALCSICLREGLGRIKPATNP